MSVNVKIIRIIDEMNLKGNYYAGKAKNYKHNIKMCKNIINENRTRISNIVNCLSKDDMVKIKFQGTSMLPTIKNNSEVIIAKVSNIAIGKIYIVKDNVSPIKSYFCHRLISIKKGKYYFRGDNTKVIEVIKNESNIIAEVLTWRQN